MAMQRRNTKQKQIILETALRLDHPTATDVYEEIHKHHPTVGRATVFRVLKFFAEEGKLRKVVLFDSGEVFDKTLKVHAHFRCIKCGKIEDVSVSMEEAERKVMEETGSAVVSSAVDFFGVCRECKGKEIS